MNNDEIITVLKADITDVKLAERNYSISISYCFKTYSFSLNTFISEGDSCFNFCIRRIEFKNKDNAFKFYNLCLKNGFKMGKWGNWERW